MEEKAHFKIRYTRRLLLAEEAATNILKIYCPWATKDQIRSWRNEVWVSSHSGDPNESGSRCSLMVEFQIHGNPHKTTTFDVEMIREKGWMLSQERLHGVYCFDESGHSIFGADLSYDEDEGYTEACRYHSDNFPFTAA